MVVWTQLRREIQQRRQYLLVIALGCIVMLIGVITSLSSLRFSYSSNRFLGPILLFMGFTAILFGVRWRKSILFTEQRQADVNNIGEVPNLTYPHPVVPHYIGGHPGNYPVDESKFLVAPAYSAHGFPAEPPPPYAPPSYEVAAASSSVDNSIPTHTMPVYNPSASSTTAYGNNTETVTAAPLPTVSLPTVS